MNKRFFAILIVALLFVCNSALAWSGLTHNAICHIADQHLTEEAKAKRNHYLRHTLAYYASWQDEVAWSKEYAETRFWHAVQYDAKNRFQYRDGRNAITHISRIWNDMRNGGYKRLDDSTIIVNLKLLVHMVGDMHCPTHSYVPGPRCFWPCTLNGKKYKAFHGLYDKMPQLIHKGKKDNQIAEELDVLKKGQIKKIVKGDLHEWVHQVGSDNKVIYEWNPHNTPVLKDNTIELSTELVNKQMQYAGYRLAYLLNKYFGK